MARPERLAITRDFIIQDRESTLIAPMRYLFAFLILFSTTAFGQTTWSDERILDALKKANEGLPMFRHPTEVGDYVVFDVHEKTYGLFLAGLAVTVDDATNTRLFIEYRLDHESSQCHGRVWTRHKGEATTAKPIFSTNGLAAAEAEARKRCEIFAGP